MFRLLIYDIRPLWNVHYNDFHLAIILDGVVRLKLSIHLKYSLNYRVSPTGRDAGIFYGHLRRLALQIPPWGMQRSTLQPSITISPPQCKNIFPWSFFTVDSGTDFVFNAMIKEFGVTEKITCLFRINQMFGCKTYLEICMKDIFNDGRFKSTY